MRTSFGMTAIGVLALLLLTSAASARPAPPDPQATAVQENFLVDIRADIEAARKLGGHKRAPEYYQEAVQALRLAEEAIAADPAAARDGACAEQIRQARIAASLARAAAAYIEELRDYRYGWQEAVRRYDGLARDVALIAGIDLDPALCGPDAGRAVVDSLTRRQGLVRAAMDSLALENRRLGLLQMGEGAVKDSTIAQLRAELGEARQRLWEMELRAGVAEADRSAAREKLRRQREREERVAGLVGLFTPDEGEILLTPEGDVRVSLTGLGFAVGSAWLGSRQEPLLAKLADAAGSFPDAPLLVEGHTDDTGARDINLDLSLRRARAVAADLAERLGVAADSIEVVGYGPDRPVATNATEEGRARNRRIEVVIKAAEEAAP